VGECLQPCVVEWNQADAEMAVAEVDRLMELQIPPAQALDDVVPTQTIGSAFAGNGVPGGRPFGRGGCIIYPYAEFAGFGETEDNKTLRHLG
jgi:hypothetical protein